MKKYLKLSLLIFICVILIAPMQAVAQMKTIVDTNKTFSGITKVEVSGGAIEIAYQGDNVTEVTVDAFLESNNHEQDIIFVKVGNVLKVSHEVKYHPSGWNNTRTKGHIKITGPKEMELEMTAGSGRIHAAQVNAEQIRLSVGSGKITANDLIGNLQVKAGSGNIQLQQIEGDVEGKVGSGSAEIREVKGNVKYNSSSGRLVASNIDGMMEVGLTSGNAKLNNITALGPIKLTSGNINAQNVGLDASSGFYGTSGNFNIQTHSNLNDFNFQLNSTSGNLTVGNSRSRRNLSIDNGSAHQIKGNITSGNITIQN